MFLFHDFALVYSLHYIHFREHISRHFMTELLDHVATLPDQLNCTQCNAYRGEKPQNLAKHIALVHSMLDFYLQNNALVQAKRKEVMAKPKKIVIGDTCPGTQSEYNLFYMNPVSMS